MFHSFDKHVFLECDAKFHLQNYTETCFEFMTHLFEITFFFHAVLLKFFQDVHEQTKYFSYSHTLARSENFRIGFNISNKE